jgi:apolipoprotein N-acyltransferase
MPSLLTTRLFWWRVAAVLFTAILQPLLSAPFSWWPFHWLSWVPFFWAIHAQEGRARLRLAALAGTVANLLIFYWVYGMLPKFASIPPPAAVLLLLLMTGALSLVWVALAWGIPRLRQQFPRGWVLLAPAWLVTIEFFMPQLFPYMQGVSHYQVMPLVQLASITGVYGISFLLFWSNALGLEWWERRKERPVWLWKQTAAFGVVMVLVLGYGYSRIAAYNAASAKAKVLTVGLIQSNLKPNDHFKMKSGAVRKLYQKLSKEAVKRGADWVIWSEGEYKSPLSWSRSRKKLLEDTKWIGKPVLLGGWDVKKRPKPIGRSKYKFYNAAFHVHPNGTYGKLYYKRVLVPFGEYAPFEKTLGFIYRRIDWNSRYTPGTGTQIETLDKIPYGFLICYEAILPKLGRDAVKDGARLLVNITYDAWFGKTTAPYQHLMLAALRSAENGVPLIRLATTGVTTTVNSLGKMQSLSPLYQRKVFLHKIKLVYLPTLYTRFGDVFAWLCVLFSLLGLLRHRWQKRMEAQAMTGEVVMQSVERGEGS